MRTRNAENYLSGKARTRCGWIIAENILALSLLGALLAGLGMAQGQGRKFNAIMLTRQRCVAAAQAQLDSIAATSHPLADGKIGELWGGVRVVIEQTDGQGQWAGFRLVKVTASASSGGRDVNVVLTRYLSGEVKR